MVKLSIAALLVVTTSSISSAMAGEVLLLDFASPTCGPCHQMEPTIESLEAAGYPIRRVDVTREPELAQRFRVSQVPCFVMTADGQETERIDGATSQERLIQLFQNAMGRVRTQSPDAFAATAAPPDPWNSVGRSASDSSEHPITRTAPLGPRAPSNDAFSNSLICSSVRLRVDDPGGHSYGTGTIIDARSGEALVITCGHLFRDSKAKGAVVVELFAVTPDGVRVVAQVPGQVLGYNLDRDIGLVIIRPESAVRVAPIAPAQTVLERGDRVVSVGCDHGKDPTALATRVTNVDRYQGPPNIEAGGAPVEGRSGGGLFNSAGQLVGVCFAADYEGNEGLYTALESIHHELDRLGLTDVYQSAASSAPEHNNVALQSADAPTATALPPIVRGQEPLQPVMPLAEQNEAAPAVIGVAAAADSSATAPAGLNRVEQAAWDEIMTRSADAEVICIIRPRDPGGKSEVITLERVSPEFVRALADRTRQVPASLTR